MVPENARPDTLTTKYKAGIELFNRGEYFDAHEVWEELWMECPSADRRFFQALIQAAVALHHFERGNHAGAARLFRSGRAYMEPFRPGHRGLIVDEFWRRMEARLAPAIVPGDRTAGPRPVISLYSEAEAGDD